MSLNPPLHSRAAMHLPALDGARGLAVLFVLFDHATDSGMMPTGLSFNRAGAYGVLLFFSLSSFLLTYLLLSDEKAPLSESRTWGAYWLRRFLRIYPLYALTLLVWAWDDSEMTGLGALNHLILRDGKEHFWTIAVEFKFYFILPLLVLVPAVIWKKNRWLAIGAAAALGLFLRFGLRPVEQAYSLTNDVWLNEYLEVFLLGSVAGFVFAHFGNVVRHACRESAALRWLIEGCAWLCLLAAFLRVPSIYNALLNSGPDVKRIANSSDFFSIVWPFFLLATLFGAGPMRSFLSFTPLRALGWISYSLYLWHPFFTSRIAELPISEGLKLPLFLTLSAVVATISYLLIERPLSRIRLAPRPVRSPA